MAVKLASGLVVTDEDLKKLAAALYIADKPASKKRPAPESSDEDDDADADASVDEDDDDASAFESSDDDDADASGDDDDDGEAKATKQDVIAAMKALQTVSSNAEAMAALKKAGKVDGLTKLKETNFAAVVAECVKRTKAHKAAAKKK